MYDYFTIYETIKLESEFLDENILHHIQQKLLKEKRTSCSKKYGYFRGIENIKIISSEISMVDGSNLFYISYTLKSILPKPGNIYESKYVSGVMKYSDYHGAILIINDDFPDNMFQIFVTNLNSFGKNNCNCPIPKNKQNPYILKNIVVTFSECKENKLRVTGEHICDIKMI